MFVCYMEGNVEDAHFLLKHGIKKKVKRNGTREPRAPGGGRQEAPAPRLTTPGFNDFI